jgi:hypothetical protein
MIQFDDVCSFGKIFEVSSFEFIPPEVMSRRRSTRSSRS